MTAALSNPRPGTATALMPYAALLGSMVSVIVGTSYAKQLFGEVGPEGTALYRAGFSAVLLLGLWRPWRRAWTRRELIDILLYGGSLGAMNLLFYKALATIPLGVAIAIEFIGPLGVSLLHSRRIVHFAWIGLAIVGLGLLLPIAAPVHALDPKGVVLALLAGMFWAFYIVFGQRGAHVHPGQAVAVGMATAALVIAPVGIVTAGVHLLSPRLMLQGLIVAVVSSALPFSLERVALKTIPGRAFGVLVAAEPALGALAGIVLLGETLSLRQGLAIALIIAAGAGSVWGSGERGHGLPESHGLPEDPVTP